MTIRKFFTFLLLSTIPFFSVMADDEDGKSTTVNNTTLLNPNKGGRPNAPARYHILCEYSDQTLTFTLPPFVSWIDVEIEQDETVVFQTVVQSSFPSTAIPALSGECTIRCTTDAGAVYEGAITL